MDDINGNSLDHSTLCHELEKLCDSDELSLEGLQELVGALSKESFASAMKAPYFLHMLCGNKRITLEILQYIFQQFPGVASVSTDETAHLDGGEYPTYPIHLACSNVDCPDFVISALINEAPLALSQLAIIEFGLKNLGDDYKEGRVDQQQVAGTPLHYYLERASNINLDLVILKELIAGFPGATSSYQEASEYQPMGVTPMYSLLSNPNIGEMHDVLQYLAETNPLQMCITGGVSDFTPIHIAIQNKGVNASIVQLLLNAWPDSIQSKSMDLLLTQQLSHKLPIHMLCSTLNDLDDAVAEEILNLLIKADPSSVRARDAQGYLPIHYAVTKKSTQFCKVLVNALPESLLIATSTDSHYESLPIHLASCPGVNLTNGPHCVEIVQYLVDSCHESLLIHDKLGQTPLHRAVRGDPYCPDNTAIIKLILAHDPTLASIKSTGKAWFGHDIMHLPLHDVCGGVGYSYGNGMEPELLILKAVQILFDAYPEGIFAKTPPNLHVTQWSPGETPLAIAKRNRLQSVARFLEAQHQYAKIAQSHVTMTTRDDNGRLPLHTALLEKATHGAIQLLLKGCTAALQVADDYGMLPLHFACRYGSVDTVRLLTESYACGLDISDGSNNYPLHHACLGSNYEVVKYLLKRGTVVSERNDDGKLPLHLLCEAEEDNKANDNESTCYVETIMLLLQACPDMVLGFV